MPNILDYLAWRGDLSMAERPFNAVDNLILAELAYADLKGLVPEEGSVTLAQAWAAYDRAGRDQSAMANDPKPLLRAAAASRRFGGTVLTGFTDEFDPGQALQFAAMRFHLEDGTVYVAYRGTDSSLAGWREDFNLSFMPEVPAQRRAALYLDDTAALCPAPLRVGGHSKGGNLAVYAAAFCGEGAFARVRRVYSNDGPGFNQAVTASAGYARVVGRSVKIIPEASLVGILLNDREERLVVKSSASGVMQHNPYSWEVLGTAFVPAERDNVSVLLDEALTRWLNGLSDAQRENLTDALFDALAASGADTFDEINANRLDSLGAIAKAIGAMDPALQKDVLATLHKLADAGWDVFWNDARRNLRQGIGELRRGRRPGPSGEQRGREC